MKKYSLGLYEKSMPNNLTWKEKLSYAKEFGYDCVEISIDETDAKLERLTNKDLQVEIKEATTKIGLPIKTMCLSGHRRFPLGSHDPEIRKRSLEIFYQAVDLADYLGVKIIQLAGYDVYYEETSKQSVKWFEENLRKGIEYASKKAVVCGFETMETPFMNTVTKAMKYVDIIDSPYLQVYGDLGNLTNASLSEGHDLYEDIKQGHGHMVAVHLKETKPGIFRDTEFGTGHVDFEKGIKALWDQGVRFFAVEFWDSKNYDFKDRLAHNYKFVTKYLDEME